MKPVVTALLLLALGHSESVFAEIYKCTDESGVSTFTDNPRSVPGKRCISMNLEPIVINAPPARRHNRTTTRTSVNRDATPAPARGDFPRVDSATQSKRDQTRRQILQDEMDTEQRLLQDAQRNLTQAGPNDSQRIALLRNEITAHQKNIEALQKELQRVK